MTKEGRETVRAEQKQRAIQKKVKTIRDDYNHHVEYWAPLDSHGRDVACAIADQVTSVKIMPESILGDSIDFNKTYDTAQKLVTDRSKKKDAA